jgi:peptidoglycan/LPS O-acetylase OafA/YrhL
MPEMPIDLRKHLDPLDGLRGIAIILVLAWHYLPVVQPWLPGWMGVDLFFVLSGYLITWRLMATKEQPHYFARFYRNRVLRIFPLYYSVVIGFLLSIHFFVRPEYLSTVAIYINHWKSFFIFTENWSFIFYGQPLNLSLGPLWSIAVEEQFYLIWPAVILLLPGVKWKIRTFLFLILLILLARSIWYLTHPSAPMLYYNTFFRIDSFVIGALLFQLHDAKIKISANLVTWIMAGLLAVILFNSLSLKTPVPDDPFMMTIGYTLLALFFACSLHLAARPEKNAFSTFLNGKFLRGAGKISYCLYLIHFPIAQVIGSKTHAYALSHWPDHLILTSYISTTISLVLSISLSVLSYRYFESWFLKFKSRGSDQTQPQPAAVQPKN